MLLDVCASRRVADNLTKVVDSVALGESCVPTDRAAEVAERGFAGPVGQLRLADRVRSIQDRLALIVDGGHRAVVETGLT